MRQKNNSFDKIIGINILFRAFNHIFNIFLSIFIYFG